MNINRRKFISGAVLVGSILIMGAAPNDQSQGAPDDSKITAEIKDELSKDPALLNGKNIRVNTKDGTVTLEGRVDTPVERAKVASIAKSVPGVSSVNNGIAMNSGGG